MSVAIIALSIVGACLCGIGQLCFKRYMQRGGVLSVPTVFGNRDVILGIVLYVGFLTALIAAYRLGGSISVVFPLMSLAYPITACLGRYVLQERFGWRVPVGAGIIVFGCVLLV